MWITYAKGGGCPTAASCSGAFTLTVFPGMVGRDFLLVVACDAPVTEAFAALPAALISRSIAKRIRFWVESYYRSQKQMNVILGGEIYYN